MSPKHIIFTSFASGNTNLWNRAELKESFSVDSQEFSIFPTLFSAFVLLLLGQRIISLRCYIKIYTPCYQHSAEELHFFSCKLPLLQSTVCLLVFLFISVLDYFFVNNNTYLYVYKQNEKFNAGWIALIKFLLKFQKYCINVQSTMSWHSTEYL